MHRGVGVKDAAGLGHGPDRACLHKGDINPQLVPQLHRKRASEDQVCCSFLSRGTDGACVIVHNALHLQICPALYAVLDKQSAEVLDFPAGEGGGAIVPNKLGIGSRGSMVLDRLIHSRCVQLLASRYHHQWA